VTGTTVDRSADAPAPESTGDVPASVLAHWDTLIATVDALAEDVRRDGMRFAMDDRWPLFARKMRLLTPQAAGPRFEAYLAAVHGWDRPAGERGAVRTADGALVSVKTTQITVSNPKANFVQVHQGDEDPAAYHLFVVDRTFALHHFSLTPDELAAEVGRCGTTTVRRTADGGTAREWAVRFPWRAGNAHHDRWHGRYLAAYGRPCCDPGGPRRPAMATELRLFDVT
jgi:hypothetical protein